MRVILDANVFISAAIAAGPPLKTLRACIERPDIDLIVCPTLWREIRQSLLTKPGLLKRISPEQTREYLGRIRPLVHVVADPVAVGEFTDDPKDNYLIALAREHDASLIVSGDSDLLDWPEQQPPVMTPAGFVVRFEPDMDTDRSLPRESLPSRPRRGLAAPEQDL